MKVRFTAESPYERARGLMFSKPLASDEIAVFKFDTDSTAGFWNLNVSYPIRIAFYDNNFNLVGFKRLDANTKNLVSGLKPYQYAVEMSDMDSDPSKLIEIKNYLEKKYG